MTANNILFVRSQESVDNPWDDTLLIRAYDEALNEAKKMVNSEIHSDKGHGHGMSEREPRSWKKGDRVRTKYSEDGFIYEAVITKICNDRCTVKYVGYGNTDEVLLSDLKPSKGGQARKAQKLKALQELEQMECDDGECSQTVAGSQGKNLLGSKMISESTCKASKHSVRTDELHLPPPPPPPPPLFQQDHMPDSNEALHAMLMSWYMSGYHTGYYQGLKRSQH